MRKQVVGAREMVFFRIVSLPLWRILITIVVNFTCQGAKGRPDSYTVEKQIKL